MKMSLFNRSLSASILCVGIAAASIVLFPPSNLFAGDVRSEVPPVPSVTSSNGTITIEGELLREAAEGGIWNVRSGSQLYDLHGDITLADGDWVRVTGTPGDKLSCYHMRGAVVIVTAMEKISAPASSGGWTAFEHSIVCSGSDGAPIKALRRTPHKVLAGGYVDPQDKGPQLYRTGGVLAGGSFAWIITPDNLFRYYDSEGKVLWSRSQTAHAVFSAQTAAALLAVRDPNCAARKAIEDCDLYAVLLSTSGQVLLDIAEAPLLDRESMFLTDSGRFGSVKVTRPIDGSIFFDALTKKKKIFYGLGLPRIDDSGAYKILGKTGEFSAVREIYSGSMLSD